MFLPRGQQLFAILTLLLLYIGSLALAKSVNLISDFVSGRPLERSASFKWVVKRDNESPARVEESLDEGEQIRASRWEPRTLGPLRGPPMHLVQQENQPEGPGESETSAVDGIEESFNVPEDSPSEKAPGARALESNPATVGAAETTHSENTQEAEQKVLTGALQSGSDKTQDTETAAKPETPTQVTNVTINQTSNQTILQTINQSNTELNETVTNLTSPEPEILTTNTTSSVSSQPAHFGQAQQVPSDSGALDSQGPPTSGAEVVKEEVSSTQPVVETSAPTGKQSEARAEEHSDSKESQNTVAAPDLAEAHSPQELSSIPASANLPETTQELATPTAEVPPALHQGTSPAPTVPNPEVESQNVQPEPLQESGRPSTAEETSPEHEDEAAQIGHEQGPPISPMEIPPSSTQETGEKPIKEEHAELAGSSDPTSGGSEPHAQHADAPKGVITNMEPPKEAEVKHEESSSENGAQPEEPQASENNQSEARGKDNSIAQHRQEQEPIEEEEHLSYRLDAISCNNVPSLMLKQTIEQILDTLKSANCSSVLSAHELKLRPATNSRILGLVMEVSSMPLDLHQLFNIQITRVSCLTGSSADKLRLYFEHELANQWLASRWRLHSKLQLDELPVEMLRSSSLSSASTKSRHFKKSISSFGGPLTGKCQKFKLETGQFYLELLSFKLGATYEVSLESHEKKLSGNDESSSEASGEPASALHDKRSAPHESGSSVRLIELRPVQLFLDHGLKLDAAPVGASSTLIRRPQQTAQILHSRNDHYRRNNWLLDLYGNWLKHEYRGQLAQVLARPAGGAFGEQLAACFQ